VCFSPVCCLHGLWKGFDSLFCFLAAGSIKVVCVIKVSAKKSGHAGFEWKNMIYDVNSALFRSFLSQKGAGDKRKMEEQKPSSQKPKANENKPVMNE
jgi:hypothetical protein